MFKAGVAKADITAFKKGVGMMGYGMWHNRVLERGTGLSARAFVFESASGKKVALVVAEIAMITISIKKGVIKKLSRFYPELGFTNDNVLLTAQHTHSGPGGYSHYGFYNFSIPGFVPDVYQAIVDGITQAIVEAALKTVPAKLYLTKSTFPPHAEVAFNRSLKAFNRNPEVKKYHDDEAHLAVDRDTWVLKIEDLSGRPLGLLNWFGVHCTSVHSDNHAICYDNKGYAAQFTEDTLRKDSGNPHFLAAFAQSAAGDVSPNFIFDERKKWMRGKFENDFESAAYNGRLQFEQAVAAMESSPQEEVKGDIDYCLMYSNFSNLTPDPEFTGNHPDACTSPACLGVAFAKGTLEGPGLTPLQGEIASLLADLIKSWELATSPFISRQEREMLFRKFKAQSPKKILFETGERKILGTRNVKNLIIPAWADPAIATLKAHHKSGSLDFKPWTPQTLPLQIVLLGNIALVAIPGEITTVAGWRLRDSLHALLRKKGIIHVQLTSYANAYSGYITTYEEYHAQCYEGGHTVFGKWTLAAFQTQFKKLAVQLLKHPAERVIPQDVHPAHFTDEELKKRSFAEA